MCVVTIEFWPYTVFVFNTSTIVRIVTVANEVAYMTSHGITFKYETFSLHIYVSYINIHQSEQYIALYRGYESRTHFVTNL